MAWSFNGTTFSILEASGPARNRSVALSRTHVPGSDRTVLDMGGRQAVDVSLPVRLVNDAAYTALAGQLGQSGTLVWVHGSDSALFVALSESRRLPDGSILAQGDWVLL